MPSSSLLICLLQSLYLLTTPTNTETINLNISQYKNKAIKCNSDEDCFINCYGYDSCAFSTILCPINHDCKIFCGEKSNACFNLIINATYSSLFELNGCSTGDLWTCSGITIYFPPKDLHGNKRSFIHGDNNLNGHSKSLHFYAMNGWSDIDSSGYIGSFEYFYGTMHCMQNYTQSCNFNTAAWLCESNDDLCNDPYVHTPVQSVSKDSAPKQIDILWYIVVTLSICICGFSVLLIYNISKSYKSTKLEENEVNTDTCTEHHENTSQLIEIKAELSKEILKSTIPQNPIQIVGDDIHNMFPLITYGPITSIASITSIPSIPMDDNDMMEGPITNTANSCPNNIDIITNVVNFSVENERINHIMDENVNEMMDMMLEDNKQELESENNDENDENDEHIPSVMFLYNSDMAIPEGRENHVTSPSPTTPHLHESFNISQSPSPTPTLSDNVDTNGLLNTVSNWPQQAPGTPAPPSSNISHASSASSGSASSNSSSNASPTTVSNMTYMTASSIINSIISESNQSPMESYNDADEDNGLRIDEYDDNECIDEKTTVTNVTQQSSSSESTPVCSNVSENILGGKSAQVFDEEEYEEYDEEDISNYRWRHNRNNSDTLIIDEDHDDTSSWISGDEEEDFDSDGDGDGDSDGQEMEIEMEDDIDEDVQYDHLKVCVGDNNLNSGMRSNSNTEYDSSTSSMGEYFTNEVTEDEEESIEIGQ